jgi:hypothetical protein
VAVVKAHEVLQSQRTSPPNNDGAEVRLGASGSGLTRRHESLNSKMARSMIAGISYSTIFEASLRSPSSLRLNFVEAAHARVGLAGEDFMDCAGAEERAASETVTALVQPHRDFLRPERTGFSIAVSREIEGANDYLRFDWFDRELFLLLVSDDLSVDGFVSEWNDTSIRVSTPRVFFHLARGRARGFSGLEFVHDADDFFEQIAAGILGERLRKRDQFNLVLAQRAHREFLLELISERPGNE